MIGPAGLFAPPEALPRAPLPPLYFSALVSPNRGVCYLAELACETVDSVDRPVLPFVAGLFAPAQWLSRALQQASDGRLLLADDSGPAQLLQAGLVSENKRLAAPASVDSIPSSAMQEDHVSMGWHAGRKLRKIVDNLRRILAIELVTAARAVEMRAPLQPAAVTGELIARLRAAGVGGVGPDRFLAPELEAAAELLRG